MNNKAALVGMMQAILKSDTRAVWSRRQQEAGVPCSPIHSLSEALSQPQVKELGMRVDATGDDFSLVGLPVSFDTRRPGIRRPAPTLGQHDDEIVAARARRGLLQCRVERAIEVCLTVVECDLPDAFAQWVPEEDLRRRILADNPAA